MPDAPTSTPTPDEPTCGHGRAWRTLDGCSHPVHGPYPGECERGRVEGEKAATNRIVDWLKTEAEVPVPFTIASSGDFHAIAAEMCHALALAIRNKFGREGASDA